MASKDGGRRSKRRKSAKVDRISSLPDEVLSHILSFLPTKCAIGTSILSKRWKYLWTSITSFDLKGPSDEDGIPEIVDFTNFVDKVFRSCNSSSIQKFRLHASWKDKTHVTDWIDEAVKRNVKEVDIDVYKLPLSLLTCTTLSVLTLSVYGCYDKDVSLNLPCLKVLHIKKGCLSIGFIEKLISSSPVLEDLTLAGYLAYDNLIVSAPALKTLRLKRKLRADKDDPPTVSAIFIKAPSLGYLHLRNIFLNNIKGDFPSLVKAYVNMGVAFTWGRKKRGTPHCFATPKFHNLTCLEVITCNYRFWRALPELIRSSPKLKVLSLKQKGLDGPVNDEYTWVEPKSVPLCFGSHLAVIKIKGLKGRNHELQLLKFCLGRAKALQSLSIRCRGLTEAEETQFCGQLLKFSRTSASCQIQFRGDIISNL